MTTLIWDGLIVQGQRPAWGGMRMSMARAAGGELEWHQTLNLGTMQPRQDIQLHKEIGTLPSGLHSDRCQCPDLMPPTPYGTVPYSDHWRLLRGVSLSHQTGSGTQRDVQTAEYSPETLRRPPREGSRCHTWWTAVATNFPRCAGMSAPARNDLLLTQER